MHTYTDDETHASLVRTFPDLTGWSLNNLLGQYADGAAQLREGSGTDAKLTGEIDREMAAIANEIDRRCWDSDAHACRLGAVGIDQLAWLAITLKVDLAALVGAISEIPKDSEL